MMNVLMRMTMTKMKMNGDNTLDHSARMGSMIMTMNKMMNPHCIHDDDADASA